MDKTFNIKTGILKNKITRLVTGEKIIALNFKCRKITIQKSII